MEQALRLAVEIGDRTREIRAISALASVKGAIGAADEALEDLATAISIAEEIDHRGLRGEAHLRMGFLLYNLGYLWWLRADIFWPLVLIALGVWLIVRRRRP